MQKIDDARDLLNELENKLLEVNKLIQDKGKEYIDKELEIKEEIEVLEEIASEREELIEILKNCSVDICKYKTAFEDIRKRHSNQIQEHISNQDFHFFLCFREDYARDGKTAIDSHQELIDKKGFCWWGKFFEKRVMGGKFKELEPFGESIRIDESSNVVKNIQAKIRERIENSKPVYLYNYNPNPPHIKLYVCNVVDFYYGDRGIPYEINSNEIPLQCAYIPRYYFHKREGNCSSCKTINRAKCKPGYTCNFWFKVDKIREIENVEEEFVNLKNCFTQDSINFAIPIFYPLLVSQDNERFYFQRHVKPIQPEADYTLKMPKGEKGHTKTEEVQKFFDDLYKACEQSFVSVISTKFNKGSSGGKDDEIFMVLPPTFRRDGKPMRFKILLEKETKPEQKQKVEKMIADHLKRS